MSCVTICTKCGALYEESSEERANEPGRLCRTCAPGVTLFMCGPSHCEHDYSAGEDFMDGGSAVCVKCGARAIDETGWQ